MTGSTATMVDLLEGGAAGAAALAASGAEPLTYQALRALVSKTLAVLAQRGIGRNDRVAMVLDNGPEMAAAFLTVASGATAAPLNPAYRTEEFEFYLTDLQAKLLIVGRDRASPAPDLAGRLGIPIARLAPHPERGAGSFDLQFAGGHPAGHQAQPAPAQPGDVALVLHTSGTTSRPKLVPLSQRNVCASARNIQGTLRLTSEDRGLIIMPLFHIHGLMAALLAPLAAGGEVCCTPGFNALKFFAWLADARPTWYTAVPTMHQAILTRASKNADVIKRSRLRVVRSSSSALP
ncbi:MAG: AMP-binding protein, partial [Gemmatimonadetes bacterium]|nr:AMP-binding protein [Gemmatimonadota bacterium]